MVSEAGVEAAMGDPLILKLMEALAEADARRLQRVALHLNEALVAMTGVGLAPPPDECQPGRQHH